MFLCCFINATREELTSRIECITHSYAAIPHGFSMFCELSKIRSDLFSRKFLTWRKTSQSLHRRYARTECVLFRLNINWNNNMNCLNRDESYVAMKEQVTFCEPDCIFLLENLETGLFVSHHCFWLISNNQASFHSPFCVERVSSHHFLGSRLLCVLDICYFGH